MSGPVHPRAMPTDRMTGSRRPELTPTARFPADGHTPPPFEATRPQVGQYRFVSKLGEGGMGVVYEALDAGLDRSVALKVLRADLAADPSSRERFLREAKAAAAVRHDNVVTIYQVGEAEGVPFLAMELLRGMPLDRYLTLQKPVSFSQAARVGKEAALGLAAAHAKGLVHRDVKPANLWLESPSGRVKVLDFGLARPAEDGERLTSTGVVMGTPAYMSPEHARGDAVDHRTDLFSLGAVLFRLITGRLPFSGSSTMAILTALAVDAPPKVRSLVPDAPEGLADVIDQLLEKDPAKRPASAEEVAKRLRAVLKSRSGGATAAFVVPGDKPRRRKPPRSWPIALASAFGVFALVAGIIVWITHKDGTRTKIDLPDGASVKLEQNGTTVAELPAKPDDALPGNIKAPVVKAPLRADPPPPPPFERKRWHREDGQGHFERVAGKNWRELSPDKPDGSFTFVEVRTTRDYLDLYDPSRDMTLRFYADGVDLLRDDQWGRLYNGHWFDPSFRPPEGKGPEGKGKGPPPKGKGEPKGPPRG
ncbi:MAG: serine/threonine-protein kinase [Gemmataceae bacterium]